MPGQWKTGWKPKLPKRIEPPSRKDPDIKRRAEEERRKAAQQKGRRATILTDFQGVGDYGGKGGRVAKLGRTGSGADLQHRCQ